MSHLSCLFSTILPDMWTQNLSARCKDDMGSSMMCLQLLSPDWINFDIDSLALDISFKWPIKGV